MAYGCERPLPGLALISWIAGRCRVPEIPFGKACPTLTSGAETAPRGRAQLDNTAIEAAENAAARHGFMSSSARA